MSPPTVQLGLGYAATLLAIFVLPSVAASLGGWRWTFGALGPGPLVGAFAMAVLRRLPDGARPARRRSISRKPVAEVLKHRQAA